MDYTNLPPGCTPADIDDWDPDWDADWCPDNYDTTDDDEEDITDLTSIF